jgi:hypothetical protein
MRQNDSANESSSVELAMPRFLLLIGFSLLLIEYSFAQDSPDPTPMQCHLIRVAVAQYGFAAARQHALETYGLEAAKTGDKCFTPRELNVEHSAGMNQR